MCSLLAHASDINDLLEGLDGVLENWLNRLHDTESSLHIVDLWLHALDGLHLSGDLNKWLSIIESLKDSSGKGFLDVLNSSSLSNGGITVTMGLAGESGGEGVGELGKESILGFLIELLGGLDEHGLVMVSSVDGGKGSDGEEFHFCIYIIIK